MRPWTRPASVVTSPYRLAPAPPHDRYAALRDVLAVALGVICFCAVLAVALLLASCTPAALSTATALTNTATLAYEDARAAAVTGETRALHVCLEAVTPPAEAPACVEATVARWAPVKAAVASLYAAILTAREVLAVARVHVALGDGVSADEAGQIARVVAAVVSAVDAVHAAAAPGNSTGGSAALPGQPASAVPIQEGR